MEQPKDNDLQEWAKYFIYTRDKVKKEQGKDIADNEEMMFVWFVMIFMNGKDEARWERTLKDAGVDDIEGYLKTLEN